MAGTFAHIQVIGNLGGDPKQDFVGANNTAKLSFSVAHSRRVKKGGEWGDTTDWWDVIVWGKQAETLAQMLVKGTKVAVSGEPQKRQYEKDGGVRYAIEIEARDVVILSPKRDGQGAAAQQPSAAAQQPSAAAQSQRPAAQTAKPTPKPAAKPKSEPPPDFGTPDYADDDQIPF